VFLYPEVTWQPIGEEGVQGRSRLVGSAQRFFLGIEHLPTAVPIRELVWPSAAYPVVLSGESLEVATLWVGIDRLQNQVRCTSARQPKVRLAGRYEVEDERSLRIRTWIESDPADASCEVMSEARARLDGLAFDLWMYGRSAMRLAVPVPVERR
jgi:hypothetical protein